MKSSLVFLILLLASTQANAKAAFTAKVIGFTDKFVRLEIDNKDNLYLSKSRFQQKDFRLGETVVVEVPFN